MRGENLRAGFSLVEIMIALLVLSVGLLGIAGMQIRGLSATRGAEQGSIATMLARDIADRMRGNPAGLQTGLYDAMGSLAPLDPGDIEPRDPQCLATGCSSGALARYDAHAWLLALANVLPAGRGLVERRGETFQITIAWDQSANGGAGGCPPVEGHRSTAAHYLACIRMSLRL